METAELDEIALEGSYERLVVEEVDDEEGSDVESNDEGSSDDALHIDVVHVTAVCPMDERLTLSDLFRKRPRSWRRRQLTFKTDLSTFLAGDLVHEFVQQESMCLLRDLVLAEARLATPGGKRSIVFVAYDLAALVVKQALAIAAGFQNEYSSIFWNTSTVIFSGCPQRSMPTLSMMSKLWSFLSSKIDTDSRRLLIPHVMENLAQAAIRASETFISTKIALRIPIVHLYAGDDEKGTIHASMDVFTATIGLPSEIAIQEHTDKDSTTRFSPLEKVLIDEMTNSHPDWLPIEQMLLALAAPPRASRLDSRERAALQPVLDSQKHQDWVSFRGSQILYLQGQSYQLTNRVADLIMADSRARLLQKDIYASTRCLSFSFDSRDPRRRSVPDMVTTLAAQLVWDGRTEKLKREFHVLRNLLLLRAGWTDKSSISLLEVLLGILSDGATIALYDFDECDRDSRRSFLSYFSARSNKREIAFKLVITSREPNALEADLAEWPKLDVSAYVPASAFPSETRDWVADSAQLCPADPRRQEMQRHLDQLAISMESVSLNKILDLLFHHTGWPDNPSSHSLSEFIRLLTLISPSDTPEAALDKMITSDKNAGLLRWVLSWLLCSYQPLSIDQLATVVECYNSDNSDNSDNTAAATVPEPLVEILLTQPTIQAQEHLRSWLCMLTDFGDGQAILRGDIVSLLVKNTNTTSYIWNEIVEGAHQRLAEFCLACLQSEKVLASLKERIEQYESALQEHHERIAVPALVLPKDRGLILYAVQALPYHLSKCRPSYQTEASSFFFAKSTAAVSALWAKAYWAMSNPLSRTPTAPVSALSICTGLDFFSYESTLREAAEDTNLALQCMSSAIRGGKGSQLLSAVQPASLTVPTCMELLLSALQANDETSALDLARGILSHPERKKDQMLSWPPLAIWTAVWLNMADLSKVLLDNGVSVEAETETRKDQEPVVDLTSHEAVGYWPSPLYLASALNHVVIVDTLLSRGAILKAPSATDYGSFQTAADRGHIDVVQTYLGHDASYINNRQPHTALWAASDWGCWHSVHVLIAAGANPNEPQGKPWDDSRMWTPLATACREGHVKTVKALLAGGADANALGPYGLDTALWFPTAYTPDLACVQVMLRYGADPNHQHFSPPLLIEMVTRGHSSALLLPVWDALLSGDRPIDLNAIDGDGKTALITASEWGKLDLVRWLLASGADADMLDCRKRSALSCAIQNGHTDVVAALLEKGARIELAADRDPLIFDAISKPSIVRLLVDSGADVNVTNSSGNMPINAASAGGHVEVVEILIEKGADINHKDNYEWPPIFDAVAYAHNASLTRLLAEKGAKMDGKVHGQTLLHKALYYDIDILKTLVEFRRGIDINSLDDSGSTALNTAVRSPTDLGYLQVLIRAGIDINLPDKNGETPLHSAAREPSALSHLELLLNLPDIDKDKASPKWGSPLCIAAWVLNVKGVRTLLDRGANANFSMQNILYSTPLMSVLCTPGFTTRSEDVQTIDVITRMLVFNQPNKASVKQTVPGGRFYTNLAAASFCASPATLKFLLEEGADVHLRDPDTNRLPHHFAASNGIHNFEAIVLSYRLDLMEADKQGKNCLHWAAQFGNLKTVQFIISQLSADNRLQHFINHPDNDGWTPLSWAVRPCTTSFGYKMRSEQPDHAGVVRTLLLKGARRDVKCRLGNGENEDELLTPLDLARRCDAGAEIISMLQHGVRGSEEATGSTSTPNNMPVVSGPVRIYKMHNVSCDICFNGIFGRIYTCNTCADYDVCTKCLAHKSIFHTTETQRDGQAHLLERNERFEEYQEGADDGEAGQGGDDGGAGEERNGRQGSLGPPETALSPEREEEILDLDDIEV